MYTIEHNNYDSVLNRPNLFYKMIAFYIGKVFCNNDTVF